MTLETLLTALAGLGLFFFGFKLVARNLGAIAGDGLRRHLGALTATWWRTALAGIASGLVMQSGRTTSFVFASFVQAGAVTLERALPVVFWANLGCAMLVFVAVLPIHLVALAMIGVAGACIAFERPRPLLGAAHAVFGLAVMLFGLKLMSAAAPLLTTLPAFAGAVDSMNRWPPLALAVGAGLTVLAQSHMAVVLISVPLVAHDLIGPDATALLVVGTHLGASAVAWLTSLHVRGEPRQVIVGQIGYGLAVGVIGTLGYAIAHAVVGGPPLAMLASTRGAEVAAMVVIVNAATAPVLHTFVRPCIALCRHWSPPAPEEELARPQYLWQAATDNAAATLMLIDREQQRLLGWMPTYFACARREHDDALVRLARHHAAYATVGQHVRRATAQLMSAEMTPLDTEWLVALQQRQDVLDGLEAACYEMCDAALSAESDASGAVVALLVEAADTFVLTLISATEAGEATELAMLDTMTANRGGAMEAVRRRYLSSTDALAPDARTRLLRVTALFERAAWSANRLGVLARGVQPAAA